MNELTDGQIDALLVLHGKEDDGFHGFARAIIKADRALRQADPDLTIAYMSGRADGKRQRQAGQEPLTIEHDKDAEIERLKDALTFVERWANHHAQKPHVTAACALSCIQHYPEIEAITESYADGKVPETRDPYAEIAALKAERDALKQDAERLD